MKRFVLPAFLMAIAAPLAAQQPPVQSVPLPPSDVAGNDGFETPPSTTSESRERLGRNVGEMAAAARRAAAQAKDTAEGAMRDFRRGFDEGSGRDYAESQPPIRYEDEAVDACALAAEDEGFSIARIASVRDILYVDRRPGGWNVVGTIELRDSYRERRTAPQRFQCAVRDGDIADIRIRQSYARR